MSDRPLIIKSNIFNISPKEMEEVRKTIKKQMEEATPVVMLPCGFELAEVNDKMLEEIKAEIQNNIIFDAGDDYTGKHIFNQTKTMAIHIIDRHIAKLKGENKEK